MKISMKVDAPGLAKWLKDEQKEQGLPVTEFCARCGFSPAYWYEITRNDDGLISQETLERIEGVLGKKREAGKGKSDAK